MTVEEIAAEIQDGREDLIVELWERVRNFVTWQAKRFYKATGGVGGVEVDDLVQSGYFAALKAVKYFDRNDGIMFNTVLGNCLKTAFADASGMRRNRKDPLQHAVSLEAPAGREYDDGETLGDLIPDSSADFSAIIAEKDYSEKLQAAVGAAVDDLPVEQRETIRRRYYGNQTYDEIGRAAGVTPSKARTLEHDALVNLRKPSAGLWRFVEDRTPYYLHVGVKSFNSTRTSAVEKIVIMRDQMRKNGSVPT